MKKAILFSIIVLVIVLLVLFLIYFFTPKNMADIVMKNNSTFMKQCKCFGFSEYDLNGAHPIIFDCTGIVYDCKFLDY